MPVNFKLQLNQASSFCPSWLSKQPQLVQSSKLLVASPSCAMLGKAQPQLVYFSIFFKLFNSCSGTKITFFDSFA